MYVPEMDHLESSTTTKLHTETDETIILSLLHKLRLVGFSECDQCVDNMVSSPLCYEIISAIETALKLQRSVKIWSDVNPDTKDNLGLPQCDVGIDFIDDNLTFAGQAKLYQQGSYVKAKDIDRTRFCAYRARKFARRDDIMMKSIVTTPENVKLGKSKVEMDDVEHVVIPSSRIRFWCEKALNISQIYNKELQKVGEDTLRPCQLAALSNIEAGRMNKIKLACGSGKTRIAAEVIKRSSGRYLVLVPYLTLLDQWYAYLKQFKFTLIRVGTGYNEIIRKPKADETVIVISVYNSYKKSMFFEKQDKEETKLYTRPYDFVVVDEAHHIIESDGGMNREIWSSVEKSKSSLLMSASLNEDHHGVLNFSYSMRDAINDGIIVDYDVKVAFFSQEPNMRMIAKYVKRNEKELAVLAYCNTIESAKMLAKQCNNLGIMSTSISCEESRVERQKILKQFENGEYRVLVSVNTLGEGVNLKRAHTCLFAEARSSEISVVQCIGRVLRLCEGKDLAHVIVCTSIGIEDNVGNHPVIKILKALNTDDRMFIKRVSGLANDKQRSCRIHYDIDKDIDDDLGTYIKENVYDRMMTDLVRGKWMVKFEMLKEYYLNNKNTLPVQSHPLGNWLHYQRQAAAAGKITDEHKKLMDDTFKDWLITFQTDAAWMIKFEALKEYYIQNKNNLPIITHPLGVWLDNQRQGARRKGTRKITSEHKELMDKTFKDWLVTPRGHGGWMVKFRSLEEYYIQNNNILPTQPHPLGIWLQSQRNSAKCKGKLTKEQKQLMDDTFKYWLVTRFSDEAWMIKFETLKQYYIKNNNTLPVVSHPLGCWLANQRQAARCNGGRKITYEHKHLMDDTFKDWLFTSRTD